MMGVHLVDNQFQSDKYPTTPLGKVPLSTKDPAAQDLLWEYAQRRRAVDATFSGDLETALRNDGYVPPATDSAPTPIDLLAQSLADRDWDAAGRACLLLRGQVVRLETGQGSPAAGVFHVSPAAKRAAVTRIKAAVPHGYDRSPSNLVTDLEEAIGAELDRMVTIGTAGAQHLLLPKVGAYGDMTKERVAQDAEHGGPEHDDTHSPSDWLNFIVVKLMAIPGGLRPKGELRGIASLSWEPGGQRPWATPELEYRMLLLYRHRLVQVGALAVAALESLDRQLPVKMEALFERAREVLKLDPQVDLGITATKRGIALVHEGNEERPEWLDRLRDALFPMADLTDEERVRVRVQAACVRMDRKNAG